MRILAVVWVALLLIFFALLPETAGLIVGFGSCVLLAAGGGTMLLFAAAAGRRIIGRLAITEGERTLFGVAIGLGLVSYGMLFLGLVGLLTVPAALAALAIVLAVGWREIVPAASVVRAALRAVRGPGLVAVLFWAMVVVFVLNLFQCLLPVLDYDALEYHLGALAEYYSRGRISFLPANIYAAFPAHTEMLYMYGLVLTGSKFAAGSFAKVVNLYLALLASAAVYHLAEKLRRGAGVFAAAVFFVTPVLGELATLNVYIEFTLCFYMALALLAVVNFEESVAAARCRPGPASWAVLAGVAAGLGCAAKYTAVLFLLLPVAAAVVILGRGVRVKAVLAVLLAAGAVASPWYLKNVVWTRNPVYPLMGRIFDGKGWTEEKAAKFAKAHGPPQLGLGEFGKRLFQFAFARSAGPRTSLLVFGLLPFAYLGLARWRAAVGLAIALAGLILWLVEPSLRTMDAGNADLSFGWVYGGSAAFLLVFMVVFGQDTPSRLLAGCFAYFAVVWFCATHQADRFLDPSLVWLVPLSALGCAKLLESRYAVVAEGLVGAVLILNVCLVALQAANSQAIQVACGGVPGREYVHYATQGTTYSAEAIEFLNRKLPQGSKVLFVGEARVYYCDVPFAANTVFDDWLLSRLWREAPAEGRADFVHRRLGELGFTHIYVNYPELERERASFTFSFKGKSIPGVPEEISASLFHSALAGRLRRIAEFGAPKGAPAPFEIYEIR